jgi:hypothetical protein
VINMPPEEVPAMPFPRGAGCCCEISVTSPIVIRRVHAK